MELTDLERAVLQELLVGDGPALLALREQVNCCSVSERELTSVGFFTTLAVPEESRRAALPGKTPPFGDVVADFPHLKHGAGFLVYVDDGVLSMLEGYTFDEPWPNDTSGFTLRHAPDLGGFPGHASR